MSDWQQIALALSQRQKAALDYIRPHSILAGLRWPAECWALADLGLVELDGIWVSITPRGLDVRAALPKTLANKPEGEA